jgi:hypothetical protein
MALLISSPPAASHESLARLSRVDDASEPARRLRLSSGWPEAVAVVASRPFSSIFSSFFFSFFVVVVVALRCGSSVSLSLSRSRSLSLSLSRSRVGVPALGLGLSRALRSAKGDRGAAESRLAADAIVDIP